MIHQKIYCLTFQLYFYRFNFKLKKVLFEIYECIITPQNLTQSLIKLNRLIIKIKLDYKDYLFLR